MKRRGLTLYEVVISLAIFAGALAAISQGMSTGTRAAVQARLQSQAVLLAQTKMAEIVSGVLPPKSASDVPFAEPDLDGWTWSATVTPGPHVGLYQVEVSVACHQAHSSIDASFTLDRLVRDQLAFSTTATQAAQTKATDSAISAQQQSQGTQQN